MKYLFTLFIFSLCIFSTLFAHDYVLVTHAKLKALTKQEVRALYLKKTSFIQNKKVIPLNLEMPHTIRKSFNKHVLQMTQERLKIYWIQQHYLGHRPPLSMKTQKSIKKFLYNVDASIGYMTRKNSDSNLTILFQWSD